MKQSFAGSGTIPLSVSIKFFFIPTLPFSLLPDFLFNDVALLEPNFHQNINNITHKLSSVKFHSNETSKTTEKP